jgi:hypothetical protein
MLEKHLLQPKEAPGAGEPDHRSGQPELRPSSGGELTAALSTVLPTDISVDRTVEIEAYTRLPAGLIFNNPDQVGGC